MNRGTSPMRKTKSRSRANLGQSFETMINLANEYYLRKGMGIIVKQNTKFLPIRDAYGRIINCKVEEKAVADFFGVYQGIPVAIEAKHTNGKSIRFAEVKDHQAAFLNHVLAQQGEAFVMVSFNLERFFCIPWEFWREARTNWVIDDKKPQYLYSKRWGYSWETTGKASVRPEELHNAWEVPCAAPYILDYLSCLHGRIGKM